MAARNNTRALPLDAPIGSIMLYGGDCSSSAVIGKLARNGWMPCDGSLLLVDEYVDLYNAIGVAHGGVNEDGVITRFNLPNLIARFVRGVNEGATDFHTDETVDPDVDSRQAANRHGNTADAVGSLQYDATGLPTTPFVTDIKGAHTHTANHLTGDNHRALDGVSFYQARNTDGASSVNKGGLHQHEVRQGGDRETRPASLSLYYIIRFA
ncbi:MAG TPA: phage tail protein [Ktedonobacteraceae bacterium]|nr:phage tail protein [Ktedonobacteraceae bacterium]